MKRYTFAIDNNFRTNENTPKNWSEILDNIIADNIKRTNNYLGGTETKCANCPLANCLMHKKYTLDELLIKAALYLADNKSIYNIPCEIGKRYKLGNTPIIFYDDEIQIGFDVFSYDNLRNASFLRTLDDDTRDTIITIYNITINL